MQRAGAGRVITENELTAVRLTTEIFNLVDQPHQIETQASAARSLARPAATRDIVNLIEEAANVQANAQRANS
jgi:UDP-N-acetylglucosamine:LPS N-acetylglucosamine transferase